MMGEISDRRLRNIDRGWAWLVMVMAFTGMFIYSSALFMGGVLYTALLEKYKEGAAKTSLVGSLSFGCLSLCAPMTGAFVNKYNCRMSIITGGILATTGFVLSAFVPSLNWTILTAGVIAGTGFSFNSAGVVCVLGFYFQRWRDHMLAIVFIIVAMAMFSSAPLALYLLETFGLSSTFLIIASIQLQICIVGVVCKPSTLEQEVHAQRKLLRKESNINRFSQYLDVSLITDWAFLSFLIGTSAWNFALCVALMHLPNYLIVLGGNDSDVNLLMLTFAISNFIGRTLGLLVVSKMKSRCLSVSVLVNFLSGVITTTFPLYSYSNGATFTLTIQLGICCGIPNSILTPLAVRFVGVSKLSEAYVFTYVFCGFGVITGPFVAGYVYGVTSSYENSFLVAGIVLLIGTGFGMVSMWLDRSETDRANVEELTVNETQKEKLCTNGHTASKETELIHIPDICVSRVSL